MRKKVISVKKKRNFKVSLWAVFWAVVLIGVAFWFYYLFFVLEIAKINKVIVEFKEDSAAKAELLKNKYLAKVKNNIFLAFFGQADNSFFSDFTEFSGGSIKVDIFKKEVNLKPQLRLEEAIWCNQNYDQCFSIDRDGIVTRQVNFTQGANILLIESSDAQLPPIKTKFKESDLYFYIKNFNTLLNKNGFIASKYQIINLTDFNVFLTDGFFLKVSSEIAFEDSFSYFFTLYKNLDLNQKKNLEYIDIRIGNRVFYKLKE